MPLGERVDRVERDHRSGPSKAGDGAQQQLRVREREPARLGEAEPAELARCGFGGQEVAALDRVLEDSVRRSVLAREYMFSRDAQDGSGGTVPASS